LNQQNVPDFNSSTRQSFAYLNPIPYTPNGSPSQQLTQVGFLSRIIINVHINITTAATGTYANFIPNGASAGVAGSDVPTPFNAVTNVTLQSNEGSQLHYTSGYGNYLANRTERSGFDQRNPATAFNAVNNIANVFSIPATYTTSTSYDLYFTLDIRVALKELNYAGLILIQNPTTRLQLAVTWNNIAANLLNMGGTTPAITVNSVTAVPAFEFFNLPSNPASYPDTSLTHIILEDVTQPLNTGQYVYRPTLGNAFLKITQQFINNSIAMNCKTDWTSLQLVYALTQNVYNIPAAIQMYLQEQRYAMPLPDGVVCWDFGFGYGIPELFLERDVIDSSQLTDLQVILNIGSGVTITGTNYSRNIREMLAPA
jgi:hypothetical protein